MKHNGELSKLCKAHFGEFVECFFENEDEYYKRFRKEQNAATVEPWRIYCENRNIKEIETKSQ
jgi:hypothetical protein